MNSIKNEVEEFVWILVYTKAKEEKRANINLLNQGFKTLFPLQIKDKNQAQPSLIPIFPRYLFVQINKNKENWTSIRSTLGVIKIVQFSENLMLVPNKVIEEINHKLDPLGVYKTLYPIEDFEEGEDVTITGGRFSGIEAIFLSNKSQDRVRLLLHLLNTTVLAEVHKSNISRKDNPNTLKF